MNAHRLVWVTALVLLTHMAASCREEPVKSQPNYRPLSADEARVLVHKGTEPAFSGELHSNHESGSYHCRRCHAELYHSSSKFDSGCGWPSFDDEIPGAVKRQPDTDGRRTEIICANCDAHLGHVFLGEGFTEKDTRHCVNSISMTFVPDSVQEERALFAGGCFWGSEYFLQQIPGVISTTVGYTGGSTKAPSYEEVCSGQTGHAEAVEVIFDPHKVSYAQVARRFFETHDPGQLNRQGPDIGEQYRSALYYTSDEQRQTAEELVRLLRKQGQKVVTGIHPATEFYPAEEYHQDYYIHKGTRPYCHVYTPRF